MSLWQDFIDGFMGRRSKPDEEPVGVELDAQQSQIASRLARLTGKRRDDVLAETYRQADEIVAGRRK